MNIRRLLLILVVLLPSSAYAQSGPRLVDTTFYSRVACDGTTDVAAALNAEIAAFSMAGGGTYVLGKKSCRVLSANLLILSNVALRGSDNYLSGSVTGGDYSGAAPAIFLNPAYTIELSSLSSIAGLTIVSTAYTAPTSYRTAIDNLATWTGTAITLTSANGATVKENFIIGFGTAISKIGSANTLIENNRGDDLSGIIESGTQDVSTTQGNEFYPFMTSDGAWGPVQAVAISSFADNGSGVWRATVMMGSSLPVGVETGDRIWIAGPPLNLPAVAGQWIVTVVDSSHVDLQGSAVTPSRTGTTVIGSPIVTGLPDVTSLAIGPGLCNAAGWDGLSPVCNTLGPK